MKNKVYNLFEIGIGIFLMSVLLFIPSSTSATTTVTGLISTNTIWTTANSPYVINGTLAIPTGITLTIEPGVVVKFLHLQSKLDVYGTLQVNGTNENKVYFTSYKDDIVGGDTNGDGNTTSPAAEDWARIIVNSGANANINNAVIRYGGKPIPGGFWSSPVVGTIVNSGTLNITNSEITKNGQYGIYQKTGTVNVDHSIINEHIYNGIQTESGNLAVSNSIISNQSSAGINVSGSANFVLNNNIFQNNLMDASINASVNFVHSNNTSENSTWGGFSIQGSVGQNSIWAPDNMPYIVNGILIPLNKTLTIEPGVVIKFQQAGSLMNVYGTLNVNGTEENKVYFTSLKDDKVGGDTNGDKDSTLPVAEDWSRIIVWENAVTNINNAVIRYGGKPNPGGFWSPSFFGAINSKGSLNITNSEVIKNGQYGIYQKAGTVNVDGSIINEHTYYGIQTESGNLAVSNSIISNQSSAGINVSGSANFVLNNNTFQNNLKDVYLNATVNFIHSNNVSEGSAMSGFYVQGSVGKNSIWTPDSMPYVVVGVSIPLNNTLTIEPGVVVKFQHSGSILDVYGTLNVNGTDENKVYFTSLKDDDVGGDTNGDGDTTLPVAEDWRMIRINSGAVINIDNTVIRYGGKPIIGGFWSPSFFGAINNKGSLNLTNSEITKNGKYGIYQTAGTSVIHNNSISDHINYGILNSSSNIIDATNNWWGDDTGPYHPALNPTGKGNSVSDKVLFDPWTKKIIKKDPVIIVPGILGSQEKNGVWIIDPILHTYDNLFDTFKANGYTDGVDLFTFPYDWHQSNVLTAFQLHQKIDEVKVICNCAKVDLVAHSMGGLASRQYIQSNYYENDVDQLIFLGTPHLGAPKAYLNWEAGEFPFTISDKVISFLIKSEADKLEYANIFDYVVNRPVVSVRELLPIYDYLHDSGNMLMRSYPTDYPRNTFLEQLNNDQNLAKLYNSGVNITNIVGDIGANSTINSIRLVNSNFLPLWEHGFPEGFNSWLGDNGLENGSGDGTVPLFSSNLNFDSIELKSEHIALPTDAEGVVYQKLAGKDAEKLIDKFKIPDIFHILFIKILSPADITVISPDGKRVGKDFAISNEVNEIDNSFYSGFLTDNEYITILNPIDGEYKVQMQGTEDGGGYTLVTGYFSETNSVSNDFTAHILPGQITELKVVINSSTPDQIDVHPTDYTPPIITINSPMANDYLHSDQLPINIIATDTESGVFSLETRFDDIIINNGDQIDLFYQQLGNHTISVTSSDYVNNISTSSVLFRVIATPSSTINDINRAYVLGWINDSDIRDALVAKIQQMIRWENRLRVFKVEEKIDKILAGQFLKFLSTHLDKQINQSAYDILKEDINWLLNNLTL